MECDSKRATVTSKYYVHFFVILFGGLFSVVV